MPETIDPVFLWMNRRRDSSGYAGVESREYVVDTTVGGWRRLVPGARFVYYRPRERTLFGTGRVERVEPLETGFRSRFKAVIDEYTSFDPPLSALAVKEFVSFLRAQPGLRGVPQNSVTYLSRDEFEAILVAAREARDFGES